MKDVKVSICIKEISTGTYYKVPVLPPTIEYSFGDAQKESVTIINLGTVDFHSGNDLDSFAWSSFFPARYDVGYCTTKKIKTPIEYRDLLESWKSTGASLQVICPAAGVNKTMSLYSFKPVFRGPEMDCYYSLEFREKRTVKPVKVDLGAIMGDRNKKTPESRSKAPDKEKPGTYTVISGDTITKIAKTYSITPWTDLYTKNKKVIGSDPSDIKPGQVLAL